MNARTQAAPMPPEVRFEPLTAQWLEAVVAIEQMAYSHPWTRGNFSDAVASGYATQVLVAGEQVLGYFVAMKGVDEVHLLNITVGPAFQRQGWAQTMLEALVIWSRGQMAHWLWLEVRESNQRALHIYEQHGFKRVGLRKAYYPALRGEREAAIVMSLKL
jgi:ribosomal-protein-alanine N-acetyltransferase